MPKLIIHGLVISSTIIELPVANYSALFCLQNEFPRQTHVIAFTYWYLIMEVFHDVIFTGENVVKFGRAVVGSVSCWFKNILN